MQPLPRSLAPLPSESIVGYLLRLAHRLAVSPLDLARMAGWLEGRRGGLAHLSRKLLLELGQEDADSFAQLTRLTVSEAHSLTLGSWEGHYPPIQRSLASVGGPSWSDSWLFLSSPRYCPQCLAGDGSPIQQQLGGPWKKQWHLPVVFACIEHRTFLRDRCPDCENPQDGTAQLIQRPADRTVHPGQCRWSVPNGADGRPRTRACGHRLDAVPGQEPGPELLLLQQHILGQLAPTTHTGQAAGFFTDLRLVSNLLTASWPHGRDLAGAELAGQVTAHTRTRRVIEEDVPRRRVFEAPPRDAVACARLLQAAQTVLAHDDLPAALATLAENALEGRPSRTFWARSIARNGPTCSERLRLAAEPLTRTFRKIGGPQGTRAPLHNDYQPEHIAAFLETAWYDRHLAHLSGAAPKLLRRTAAVRLVQWARGGSLGDAAGYLGINPGKLQFKPSNNFQKWLHEPGNTRAVTAALHNLAANLSTARRLIDYQRRRDALRDWALDEVTWQDITASLPPIPGPNQPVTADRKRQDASVYIWTAITRGEHLFAPRPIQDQQPAHIQKDWATRHNTTWFQITRPDPLRHYADLRVALDRYAKHMARRIDGGTPAPVAEREARQLKR
jgi:TniQ protein